MTLSQFGVDAIRSEELKQTIRECYDRDTQMNRTTDTFEVYLTKWKVEYVDDYDREYTGDNFFKSFVKHLVIGVDYIPSDNFWLGIGYNPKTALDMKLQGSNALAGFSGGAGVRIKMFDVGVSVAKYHPSALSMMLSISTTISDF